MGVLTYISCTGISISAVRSIQFCNLNQLFCISQTKDIRKQPLENISKIPKLSKSPTKGCFTGWQNLLLLLDLFVSLRNVYKEPFKILVGVCKISDIESVIAGPRNRKRPLPIALFFYCQMLKYWGTYFVYEKSDLYYSGEGEESVKLYI